ncbi:MAG: efflux transporter outer membrane subunit [Methylococcales bacterium]
MAKVSFAIGLTITGLLVSGCTLGPDFNRPVSPEVTSWSTENQAANIAKPSSASGQALLADKDIPGLWWQLFRSKALNALIEQALTRNPGLQSAQATLTAAQEDMLAKSGSLLPKLDAGLSTKHQKVSGAQFGNPNGGGSVFTLYNASVNVSYTLDVFGGLQRQIEALEAQAEYQRFQLEGAFLTLAANIVTSVIQEASLRAQISATEEITQAYSEQLDITKQQFEIGSVAKAAVLSQQTLLEQTRTSLPTLHKQLAPIRHRLNVLVGNIPGSAGLIAQFTLNDLQLPAQIPLSLPSKLVGQRPDIRAQEAVLHAASAQIGVVAASVFPDFTISANLSSIATTAGNLFMPGTAVWGVGATLLQPLFRGGEFTHKKRAAIATYEQAAADYRSTVLKALQDVADTLSALEFDNAELQAQDAIAHTATTSLELIQSQLQVGAASHLDLLDAQRAYQQARLGQLKAQAQRFADTAALFQALGGGWWNRDDLAKTISAAQKPTHQATTLFEIPRFRTFK